MEVKDDENGAQVCACLINDTVVGKEEIDSLCLRSPWLKIAQFEHQ